MNAKRERTEEYVQRLESGGAKALFVTVDAPQLGRRERICAINSPKTPMFKKVMRLTAVRVLPGLSVNLSTRAYAGTISHGSKSITKLPIILKVLGADCTPSWHIKWGVPVLFYPITEAGNWIRPVWIIEILPEAIDALAKHDSNWRSTFEVYVDGGIRRGSDIFKALALGATAVGIGRPVLYSLASYGQPGVEKLCSLFKDELSMVT